MNSALKDFQNVTFILNLWVQDVLVANTLGDQRRGIMPKLVHRAPTQLLFHEFTFPNNSSKEEGGMDSVITNWKQLESYHRI
jgi:hypothetical protein